MICKAELDPIELEIAWGQLVAIIDEAALTLVQTAFSAVVREAKDYTIVLMDIDGPLLSRRSARLPSMVQCRGRCDTFWNVCPRNNGGPTI